MMCGFCGKEIADHIPFDYRTDGECHCSREQTIRYLLMEDLEALLRRTRLRIAGAVQRLLEGK